MSDVRIRFTSDTKGIDQGVSKVNKNIRGVQSVAQDVSRSIGSAFKSAFLPLAAINTVVAAGLGVLVKSASKAAAEFETMGAQLEVLTGSAEKAAALFDDIKEFGAKTPLEQKDLLASSKTLLNFGVVLEDVMPTLKMLGDISGGNAEKLNSLALVFGQVTAAGRLMGGDVMQMTNAGFNPLNLISKELGLSMVETKKKMEDGGITVGMLTNALRTATSQGGSFYNMLNKISNTTSGKLSNLSDNITELKVAFGVGFNEGLKDILDNLNTLLPTFKSTVTELGISAGKLATVLAREIPVSFNALRDMIKESGGIGNALKLSIVRVLKDSGVVEAVKQLGEHLIPESLRKGPVGQAAAAATRGSMQNPELLALAAMTAFIPGGKGSGGAMMRGLGLGTGIAALGAGSSQSRGGGINAAEGALMVGGGMGIIKHLWQLEDGVRGATKGAKGLTPAFEGLEAASKKLNIQLMAAGATGALVGTAVGQGIAKDRYDSLKAEKYVPSSEAITRNFNNALDKFRTEAGLLTDAQLLDSMKNFNAKLQPRTTAEEWKKLVDQGKAANAVVQGASSPMTPAWMRNFTEWSPDTKKGGMKYDPTSHIAMQQELYTQKRFPVVAKSLAMIGGARAFTGNPVVDQQKLSNKYLLQLVKLARKSKGGATFA